MTDPADVTPEAIPLAFVVGDLVQLKSGGPAMTVTAVFRVRREYGVTWFNGAALSNQRMPEAALRRAGPETTSAERLEASRLERVLTPGNQSWMAD